MSKIWIALIAILIASVAFVSCERAQKMLDPVADDAMIPADDTTTPADGMTMDLMKTIDPSVYTSWAHVALPAPTMTVAEAAAAGNAAGTGAAHNPGSDVFTSRIAYINDIGAMANKAGTTPYPDGTIIVKAIMNETETAVDKVAVMVKSPDPMYAGHNGWMYAKYFIVDGMPELKAGSQVPGHEGNGCHGCHAKADNDSVFISLSMDDMMTDDDMTHDMDGDMDGMKDEGMDTDQPGEAATSEPSDGHGADDGHDAGDGHGADDGHDAGEAGEETEAASIANDDVQ